MGMYYSGFLGPYVRCSVGTKPCTEEIKLCSKRGCRFAKKSNPMDNQNNFCPQCGAPPKVKVVKIKGAVDDVVDQYDAMMATKERLTVFNGEYDQEGIHLFVSNYTKSPGIRIGSSEPCGEIRQYNGVEIDKELMAFRDRHDKDLEILYEHYGEDKVEVCWGLLGEIS